MYLHGQPLALITIDNNTPTVYYIHNDHLGTPQKITDQNQTIVWAARYTPFGDAAITIQTIENPLRFPGQYYDQETGLHYNWHRYYDPGLGRFISSDPIGLDDGPNTYAYVGNSPINYIDPLGLNRMDRARALREAMTPEQLEASAKFQREIALEFLLTAGGGFVASVGRRAILHCLSKATKAGDDFVDGYRAVSKAEADDIAKHGFRPKPDGRSMQDKWFSETQEGAEKFKKLYPDLDSVIKTKVPKDVYDRSYKHSNIDNTGPGFCVACENLKRLK